MDGATRPHGVAGAGGADAVRRAERRATVHSGRMADVRRPGAGQRSHRHVPRDPRDGRVRARPAGSSRDQAARRRRRRPRARAGVQERIQGRVDPTDGPRLAVDAGPVSRRGEIAVLEPVAGMAAAQVRARRVATRARRRDGFRSDACALPRALPGNRAAELRDALRERPPGRALLRGAGKVRPAELRLRRQPSRLAMPRPDPGRFRPHPAGAARRYDVDLHARRGGGTIDGRGSRPRRRRSGIRSAGRAAGPTGSVQVRLRAARGPRGQSRRHPDQGIRLHGCGGHPGDDRSRAGLRARAARHRAAGDGRSARRRPRGRASARAGKAPAAGRRSAARLPQGVRRLLRPRRVRHGAARFLRAHRAAPMSRLATSGEAMARLDELAIAGQRSVARTFPARRSIAWLWPWVPLIAVAGLRGDTRDTDVYLSVFHDVVAFPWDPVEFYAEHGMEWGYALASWALKAMGMGSTTFFVLISAATCFFIARASLNVGLGAFEAAPFYVGCFFLLQQLMEIRQGLGSAFGLWVVTLIAARRQSVSTAGAQLLAGAMIHLTATLPVVGAHLLRRVLPRPTRIGVVLWAAAIAAMAFAFARAFMHLDIIAELGRLSVYAEDETYSATRDILAPANVRASLLLLLFVFAAPATLLRSRAYVLMIGLYAAHVGIRFGFFDFLILSGRLASAVGFVEVLLLPMLLRARVRRPATRWAIGLVFIVVQGAVTLGIQAPYLIDDYFTPLYADRSAG